MYRGLTKPNRICRLGETSELSVQEIHRHVRQFVHGTRNLWRQGTVFDKGRSERIKNIRGKHRSCKKSSSSVNNYFLLFIYIDTSGQAKSSIKERNERRVSSDILIGAKYSTHRRRAEIWKFVEITR